MYTKPVTLAFIQWLAEKAGELIKEGFVSHTKMKSEWKEDQTPVTQIDKEVNDFVLQALNKEYPYMSIISEEGSDIKNSEWAALCDPIDGTIPYATGIPVSTFCLSILHNGVPVFAVIYDPFLDRKYSAEKGEGAFLNGQKLQVSQQKKLDSQTHASIMWWKGSPFNLSYACNALVKKKGIKWMNLGTIGIVGGLVAAGQFEFSLFPGNMLWETSAMSLIVEEAGGRCTDLRWRPIDFLEDGKMKGHLISNGFLHNEIIDIIRNEI